MIYQIKSILGDYQCRVNEAKNQKKCYYVTHIAGNNKHVDKAFSATIIKLFKTARKITHNHYLIDLNGINISEIARFKQHKLLNEHSFKSEDITSGKMLKDLSKIPEPAIRYIGGEWEYDISCEPYFLVFNREDIELFAVYSGFINDGFYEHWMTDFLSYELEPFTVAVESEPIKNVGVNRVDVEYRLNVLDVFSVHAEKYHVLINTTSEVV